ncbi:hypothetical protein [Cupriavidus agavae]|uniref:Uncharacterized protein n=1 Tax=Cupriavidus agavae TaxID=1001822 RepID=A0A4Q7S9B9_9BURK|nr:hypothetical protein [Cupriavidus agavae]RZT42398.1 hypothetical protein EV147_1431 [Cupriavidus agavae]
MKAILACAVAALGIVACATSAAPELETLVGDLRIKGSAPFPVVMLETADRGTWELSGMGEAQARELAGRRVEAKGKVVVPPGPATWLPRLQVVGTPEAVAR